MPARRIYYGTTSYWQFPILQGHLQMARTIIKPRTRNGVLGVAFHNVGYHAPVSTLISGCDVVDADDIDDAYVNFAGYVNNTVGVYDERGGWWPTVKVLDVKPLKSFQITSLVGQFNTPSTSNYWLFCEWLLQVLDQ